jgi:outer membrane protein with beta-barrel domain
MKRIMLIAAAVCIVFSGQAFAQDEATDSALDKRAGYVSIGLQGGGMVSPDMAGAMINLDYFITDEISVGPYFQIGGGEDDTYWSMSGQIKYSAALVGNNNVRPYGHLGIGFIEPDFEDGDDELTYLFPIGGGIEFGINDMLSIDMGGIFNVSEDSFAGLLVGVRLLL